MPSGSGSLAGLAPGGYRVEDAEMALARLFGVGVRPLRLDDAVFSAMLDGWRRQQLSRGSKLRTVEANVVQRVREHADAWPWEWQAEHVEDFIVDLGSMAPRRRPATLRNYQSRLRSFLGFLADPRYPWQVVCDGSAKPRTVLTVFDWAADVVAQYVAEIRPQFGCDEHPALWVTERGGRVAVRSIDDRFAEYRDALGLARASWCRHSYVTHLQEDGFDPLFVKEQVGHRFVSTTALYTAVSSDYKDRVLEAAIARQLAPTVSREG
jgi:hypothetical protein